MDKSAVHVIVRGKVQGVFFRASTHEIAEELGLAGWVRNCPDGSVELQAEGDRAQLEELIAWCRNGPPSAKVQDVDVAWVQPEGQRSFEVLHK
jgi:acylphosphatase